MNATAKPGIWMDEISPDVTILFDTTTNPEHIYVQERGQEPIRYNFEDGITEKDILRVTRHAMELIEIEEIDPEQYEDDLLSQEYELRFDLMHDGE